MLFTMSICSALYPGENYTFVVNTTDTLTWGVVGNSSSMEGFNVSQEIKDTYSIITFAISFDYEPDNFTIILISNNSNQPIAEIPSGGGGGSGGTRIIYRNNTIEKNNTVYVDREIIVTKEVPVPINLTDVDSEDEDPNKKYSIWILILSVILACFLTWCIYTLTRKKKEVIEVEFKEKEEEKKGEGEDEHSIK